METLLSQQQQQHQQQQQRSSTGLKNNNTNCLVRQTPYAVLYFAYDYICIRQTRQLSFYQASEAVLEMDPISFFIKKYNRVDQSFLFYIRFFTSILVELNKGTHIKDEYMEKRIRDRFISNIIRLTKTIPKNDVRRLLSFLLRYR